MPRKPLHRFAVILWCAAVLFIAIEPWIDGWLYSGAMNVAYVDASEAKRRAIDLFQMWVRSRDAVLRSLELAAAGFLIELLDQVRWALISPEERARHRPLTLRRLRALGVGGADPPVS